MASGGEDLMLALKETVRYGLFLGTFAGTFVSVDELIAALGGHQRYISLHLLSIYHSISPCFMYILFETGVDIES